jgi:hypothetical protein
MAHKQRMRLSERELKFIKDNCKKLKLIDIANLLQRNHTTIMYWYNAFLEGRTELKIEKAIRLPQQEEAVKMPLVRPPAIYSNKNYNDYLL